MSAPGCHGDGGDGGARRGGRAIHIAAQESITDRTRRARDGNLRAAARLAANHRACRSTPGSQHTARQGGGGSDGRSRRTPRDPWRVCQVARRRVRRGLTNPRRSTQYAVPRPDWMAFRSPRAPAASNSAGVGQVVLPAVMRRSSCSMRSSVQRVCGGGGMRSSRDQRAPPPVRLTDSGMPRGACCRSQRIVGKCSGWCSRMSARRSARSWSSLRAGSGGARDECDAQLRGPPLRPAGAHEGLVEALCGRLGRTCGRSASVERPLARSTPRARARRGHPASAADAPVAWRENLSPVGHGPRYRLVTWTAARVSRPSALPVHRRTRLVATSHGDSAASSFAPREDPCERVSTQGRHDERDWQQRAARPRAAGPATCLQAEARTLPALAVAGYSTTKKLAIVAIAAKRRRGQRMRCVTAGVAHTRVADVAQFPSHQPQLAAQSKVQC